VETFSWDRPADQATSQGLQGYQVHLPLFEGPLDLLLHLIEREQLDITKVALAQVTDQYLRHLAVLKEIEAETLTDFLVVAARLLLIKSNALLPKPPLTLLEDEEEDVGDQLARQLSIYKQFKEVARTLGQRELDDLRGFVRLAPPPQIEPRLSLDDVTVYDLLDAVRWALAVRPADPGVDEVVSPITMTIGEQMELIRDRVSARARVSFAQLLHHSATRVEVIVTFIAVLELIKQYVVDVQQDAPFGDIIIVSRSADPVSDSLPTP
jgi:segregation and condensation protein A